MKRAIVILLVLGVILQGCKKKSNPEEEIELEAILITNLYAPQEGSPQNPTGPFTKFNFETGQEVDDDTWDVAFRGTTIIVNGGELVGFSEEPQRTGNAAAYIATGTLDDITEVEVSLLEQDHYGDPAIPTGSGNGWYIYDHSTYTVSPIPGRVLVFRTHDNHYVKMEILSYYKDTPENPDPYTDEARYYTFRYVYQTEEGTTHF